MAMDRALMESVRSGGSPVLRLYRWAPACLSLGRNQPGASAYDAAAIADLGLDVVRRPTGGRAVLHHRELTYAVVMPHRAMGTARAAYARINRALLAGLMRLGVPAMLQPRPDRRAPKPSLVPCFRDPAEGEIVVGGRKLIGSAQVREAGIILQHGSLLLADDQSMLRRLLPEEAPALDEPPATLSDFLDPVPPWERLVEVIVAGWQEVVGPIRTDEVTAAENHRAGELSTTASHEDNHEGIQSRSSAPPSSPAPALRLFAG